jgi:Serum amyloid A protein
MRTANTVGADKFFHCMANCQSARRGSVGTWLSRVIGEGRELSDQYIKGDSPEACDADRAANATGRSGGGQCGSCEDVCSVYRPNGLVYPVRQFNQDGCDGFGSWRCK